MASSREFRKIDSKHVQSLMKVSPRQATRILEQVRNRFDKPAGDPVFLPELCTFAKFDIDKVCAYFNWD